MIFFLFIKSIHSLIKIFCFPTEYKCRLLVFVPHPFLVVWQVVFTKQITSDQRTQKNNPPHLLRPAPFSHLILLFSSPCLPSGSYGLVAAAFPPFIWSRSCSLPLSLLLWFDANRSLWTCQKCPTLAQFVLSYPSCVVKLPRGLACRGSGIWLLQETNCCLPEINVGTLQGCRLLDPKNAPF